MGNVYKTAHGDQIDIDMLRLSNEEVIAVGNMRTNARGDQLGPGGKVVKTRAQVMTEYHKLNTPVADDSPIGEGAQLQTNVPPQQQLRQPTAVDTPVVASTDTPAYVKPRGSFAGAVAEQKEITQELLEPEAPRNSDGTTGGVQRI
jgi:hypothetical protein